MGRNLLLSIMLLVAVAVVGVLLLQESHESVAIPQNQDRSAPISTVKEVSSISLSAKESDKKIENPLQTREKVSSSQPSYATDSIVKNTNISSSSENSHQNIISSQESAKSSITASYVPTLKDYKQFYKNKSSKFHSPQQIKEELPPPPPQG